MKKQFVTYEIALTLKKLGFDEKCFGFYDENKVLRQFPDLNVFWNKNSKITHNRLLKNLFRVNKAKELMCTAPIYQQVIDWLREKYNLFVRVDFFKLREDENEEDVIIWEYSINEKWTIGKEWYEYSYGFKHCDYRRGFTSYYIALEEAILKAIELTKNTKS